MKLTSCNNCESKYEAFEEGNDYFGPGAVPWRTVHFLERSEFILNQLKFVSSMHKSILRIFHVPLIILTFNEEIANWKSTPFSFSLAARFSIFVLGLDTKRFFLDDDKLGGIVEKKYFEPLSDHKFPPAHSYMSVLNWVLIRMNTPGWFFDRNKL